jgi:hypothetical protein
MRRLTPFARAELAVSNAANVMAAIGADKLNTH